MENRDRDKMSENSNSTSAGSINRDTSSRKGEMNSDSDASFGQNIGRSEKWDSEPSRRSGSNSNESSGSSSSSSGYSSSSGRGSQSGSEH